MVHKIGTYSLGKDQASSRHDTASAQMIDRWAPSPAAFYNFPNSQLIDTAAPKFSRHYPKGVFKQAAP